MNTVELQRLLDNIVRRGTIAAVNFSDPVQPLCQVKTGEIVTRWIPIAALRTGQDAEHDPVEVGEAVVLLCPSGALEQAIVIGKLFTTHRPSPSQSPTTHVRKYRDGAVISYDSQTHQLTAALPAGAVLSITSPAQVVINTQTATVNAAQTTLNGNLQVNGEIKSTGDVVSGSVSLQQHVHGGVQGGPSSTGKPQ